MDGELLFTVGVILILAGFLTVLLAGILLFLRAMGEKGEARGGGVVMIGPFPIVFGTDKESVKVLILLSIALIVLVFILMIFSYVL